MIGSGRPRSWNRVLPASSGTWNKPGCHVTAAVCGFFPEDASTSVWRVDALPCGVGREERLFFGPGLISDWAAGVGELFFSGGSAVLGRSLSKSRPLMALISFPIKIRLTYNSFHFSNRALDIVFEQPAKRQAGPMGGRLWPFCKGPEALNKSGPRSRPASIYEYQPRIARVIG